MPCASTNVIGPQSAAGGEPPTAKAARAGFPCTRTRTPQHAHAHTHTHTQRKSLSREELSEATWSLLYD